MSEGPEADGSATREEPTRPGLLPMAPWLQAAFDQLPHLVYVKDATGRFLYANQALASAYGAPAGGLLHTFHRDWHRDPDELARLEDAEGEALLRRLPRVTLGERFTGRDGRLRVLQTIRVPLLASGGDRPSLLVVSTDITELELAGRALRDSEASLRLTLENSPLGIVTLSPEGRFRSANAAFCDMAGYSLPGLRRLELRDLLAPAGREAAARAVASLLSGEGTAADFEAELQHKDGRERCLRWRADTAREPDGQTGFVVAVVEDVTACREHERQQRQLEGRLAHSQKLESLGRLARGISHDFNNLLQSILGGSELALEDLSPVSPARASLEQIRATAERGTELCRALLEYAGQGTYAPAPLDLSAAVQSMSQMLILSTPAAVLTYNLADDLPAVEADQAQLRQVLMNLVSNAAESLVTTGGVITITTGVRDWSADELEDARGSDGLPAGRYVGLTVTDTGRGLAAAEIESMFDPFYTTKQEGRGLGLSTVLGIVRRHRGGVLVASEPGRGTAVTVLLPALPADSRAPVRRYAAMPDWKGSGTILVVDDDEDICVVLARMLDRLGFEAVTAASGEQALQEFEAHREEIVLVLVDMAMPGMSGEEVFIDLRGRQPDVKVVLTSGYDLGEAVSHLTRQGMVGFLQKPYRMEDLRDLLRSVLAARQHDAGS